ncbi:ankyrin repeat-containing domain protein, partial [Lactarius akahatsu]
DQAHSTPLHLASSKGNAETVELLLKHGADVHAQDQDHSTPLHLAPSQDRSRSMGFDPESSKGSAKMCGYYSSTGRMPTHWMRSTRCLCIWHLHAQDRNHWTPLHLASLTWNTETMRLLMEHEADVNARCLAHLTPLHLASYRGNSETVELLLQHGADVHARDRDQSTPLHVASCCGNLDPVQRLIQHGADVNAHNYSHSTPLHLALKVDISNQVPGANVKANVQVVSLLLEHGANVDVEDDEGRTPLQIASSMGQCEITQIFSDCCAIVE